MVEGTICRKNALAPAAAAAAAQTVHAPRAEGGSKRRSAAEGFERSTSGRLRSRCLAFRCDSGA